MYDLNLLLRLQALLEYEKHLRKNGDLNLPGPTLNMSSSLDKEVRNFLKNGGFNAFGFSTLSNLWKNR